MRGRTQPTAAITAILALLAATSAQVAAQEVTDRFAAGTWTAQAYGAAALGDGDGKLYTAHVGGGYHLLDDFSINLDVFKGWAKTDNEISAEGKDGPVFGFDLLLRYHFHVEEAWSLYLDGGAGVQQSHGSFPANGTHFNFRPQLGLGATLELGPETRLMTGARYLHVSNAGKSGEDDNPGFDAVLVYAGVMWEF